jgi:hypothetical protein
VEISSLRAAVDAKRARLDELPGVVGSGIGLRGGKPNGEVVIRVFVDSAERAAAVRAEAENLLNGAPFEVVVTGVPEAHGPQG